MLKRIAALLLAAGLGFSAAACSGSPSVSHAVRSVAPAAQTDSFPYPVIVFDGDGKTIGAEHGRRFGDAIRELHTKYFESYFGSALQRTLALSAATAFEGFLLPEHRAEVQSLAKSTSIDERQVMLAQCFLDLSAMAACSTITLPSDASPDGVARFGRNLEFPSFNVADKTTAVLAYRPAGRFAFVSIAWPGLVGVLSGMNEHGLAIANMEVNRPLRLPAAMPYSMLYRSVLEQCRTTEEAIAFLEKTPRQSANNLMVMDASGERAVIEITPEGIRARRGKSEEALISTNHQRNQDADTKGRCDRYDRLHATASNDFGHIDRESLHRMLKAVSQKKMTIQSMIFEPGNGVIYLSAGANAAQGEFHRLDVKELLQKN